MAGEAVWVGLDLGQEVTNICVVDDLGKSLREQACSTQVDELDRVLTEFRPAIGLVAVEAGTETHIVRKLRDRGYPVSIFEARKASKFLAIRRNKTDSSDAKGIADLGRLGRATVSQVHLKSLECQRLRSQLVLRQKLVQFRVAAEASVRARLRLYGRRVRPTSSGRIFRQRALEQLEMLATEEGIDLTNDMLPLIDISGMIRSAHERLQVELVATAEAHPICQRLMQVPGVGPICALSFYSAIEEPGRFRRGTDVGAYLGLTPRRLQSGGQSRMLGITKNGNKLTRTYLVAAALTLMRLEPECALSEWALKLRARIGVSRSKVALARKIAVILLTMWKTGRDFEPFPASNGRGLPTA